MDFRAGFTQSATSTEPPHPQQRPSLLILQLALALFYKAGSLSDYRRAFSFGSDRAF
jgi:hypothetical protein